MTRKHLTSFVALVALGTGCMPSEPLTAKARGVNIFSLTDYGDLPELPASNLAGGGDDFEGLINPSGQSPKGLVLQDTTLTAGSQGSCAVASGTQVYLVARRVVGGTEYYIAQLETPCTVNGQQLAEGYVPARVIAVTEIPREPDTVVTVPETTDQTGSDDDDSGVTVEENVEPGRGDPGEDTTTAPETPDSAESYDASCKDPKVSFTDDKRHSYRSIQDRKEDGLALIPGKYFRERGDRILLRFKAHAHKVKLKAEITGSIRNTGSAKIGDTLPEKTLRLSGYEDSTESKGNSYIIPFEKFIPENSWTSKEVLVLVTPFDEKGKAGKTVCRMKLRLASPIVFDFSGEKSLSHLELGQSKARFDLDADGVAEQTGWIRGGQRAFLALDHNGNGRIDDGSELFGDHTRGAKKISDGYEALAQFDADGNGVIDTKDPVFAHLLLWFDADEDGRSRKGELVSLASKRITSISLSKHVLTDEKSASALANDVRFGGRFFGPRECGREGCPSYDIFFATAR